MNVMQWYFGFHPSARPWARGASAYMLFGHVEAFGYTQDDTWLFFDPQGRRTTVLITHRHDAVNDLLAQRYINCHTIIRINAGTDRVINPLRGPTTCVSQCAALMGWRAYTLGGFRRKLLANGGEVIHERRTTRERSRQGSADAGAEAQ